MAIKSKRVRYSGREKSKFRIRAKLASSSDRPRVSVFKSSKHTYAQIVSDLNGGTIAAASTLDKEVLDVASKLKVDEAAAKSSKSSKSVIVARAVGIVLARRGVEKKVTRVVFDRNGFTYTGRIQAIAEGAREGGLDF